jgi:hypothetical protein
MDVADKNFRSFGFLVLLKKCKTLNCNTQQMDEQCDIKYNIYKKNVHL